MLSFSHLMKFRGFTAGSSGYPEWKKVNRPTVISERNSQELTDEN